MVFSLNPRAVRLEVPGIRQFSNQIVHFPDAIDLTLGQPDFPTPDKVKEAAISAILENRTGYSHNAGLLELRQEVHSFFSDKYGLSYDPENEIVITIGASEALDSTFRTLLEEDDEVILPAPIYSGYVPLIELCGAKVVYLDTTDTGFKPCPKRLKSLINRRTKAILFNYPSNPTGVTLSFAEMKALADVISEHNLFVISDEIYSENSFLNQHVSFASFDSIRNQTILIHGLSKSHSMTGWRIGFVLGPKEIVRHILKVHLYNSVCAPLPSQFAAIEALRNNRQEPEKMNKAYIQRRDYVYDRLVNMGLPVEKPEGAFYIFPSIQSYCDSSYDFAVRLLREGGLAVVPGNTFTPYGEGYIRISYAYSMDVLEEGLNRLDSFIRKLAGNEGGHK
jgi:aminotransferase